MHALPPLRPLRPLRPRPARAALLASWLPFARLALFALFALAGSACSKLSASSSPDAGAGLGVGMACQSQSDCRSDLGCDSASKRCAPVPGVIAGGACTLSAECLTGNYCTQQGVCAPSGSGAVGAVCSSEGDCSSGLGCALSGLTGVCQSAGTGDVGRGCTQSTECMAGLMCITGVCSQAFTRPWAGAVCPADAKTAQVYFHVPRASDPAGNDDFYRLPFPNDIRLEHGKVSLAGHPTPGARILPFDLVQRYISAIEAESTGFGANQAVYFRFSKALDLASAPANCSANLIDITPGSFTYGLSPGFQCSAQVVPSAYVCAPNVWIRPSVPLRPGTTYAAVLKKGFTDPTGIAFGPDDDFSAMLAPAAPSDPDLAAAWSAYGPLRDYLAAVKTAPATSTMDRFTADDLVAAAVFTVEKYEDPLAAIDNAIANLPAPAITGMVHCGDPGVVSPCDDGLTGAAHLRGCLPEDSASASFDTYQGLLALPMFQKGTVPFLTPDDGGDIEYQVASDGGGATVPPPSGDGGEADGGADGGVGGVQAGPALAAVVQRTAPVCFSLTVPKGVAPPAGWPLVVYGHGTGGSYRSIVASGLAEDFAAGKAPAGLHSTAGAVAVPMATLGYDGVMHGTRAGGSSKPVGELVYNFLNPAAARDNALQAAADLMAIPRAVAGFAGLGIAVDAHRLALYGHSQGGNAASLVGARQSSYQTIVMSGTGGLLIETLLGKTAPVNLPAVLPPLLGEASADPKQPALTASDPVLNLMQMYFERSDSVNFGRRLFKEPGTGMTPHHVLHVFGTSDSYAVVPTQKAYALAAGFQVALPVLLDFGLPKVAPPVWNDEDFGPFDHLTAVELQYSPDPASPYDGHFVSTQNPAARAAIQQMLVTTFRDGIPTVSP